MEGFVYIWFDRKRRMYYIGSRKGNPNDGYICSSVRMKNAFHKRPVDFRRRIIVHKTNFSDYQELLSEEQKWLSKIPESELGIKYYNLKKTAAGGCGPCSENAKKLLSEARKGKKPSKQTIKRMSVSQKLRFKDRNQIGINNPSFEGWYHTPWGRYESALQAKHACPYEMKDVNRLYIWCKTGNQQSFQSIGKSKVVQKSWIGKTPKQLGFCFEEASR